MDRAFQFLKTHKDVAFATVEGDFPELRVFQVMNDVPDETCREIYNDNPVLPRLYNAYTDLVYFRLEPKSLDYYDLTPTPPEQYHIDYGQKEKS